MYRPLAKKNVESILVADPMASYHKQSRLSLSFPPAPPHVEDEKKSTIKSRLIIHIFQ